MLLIAASTFLQDTQDMRAVLLLLLGKFSAFIYNIFYEAVPYPIIQVTNFPSAIERWCWLGIFSADIDIVIFTVHRTSLQKYGTVL